MAVQNVLHQLVRSLGKEEASGFEAWLLQRQGNPTSDPMSQMVKLYKELRRQSKPNDSALRKWLGPTGGSKHLSTLKSSLEDILLDYLRNLRAKENKLNRIQYLVEEAEICKERKVPEGAVKLLTHAKKLANQYEQPEQLLDVLRLERKILKVGRIRHPDQDFQENYSQSAKCIQQITSLAELRIIADELFIRTRLEFRTREFTPSAWLKKKEAELMTYDPKILCFEGRRTYWNAMSLVKKLQGDVGGFYKMSLALVKVWDEKPLMQKAKPKEYKLTLGQLLSAGHEAEQYQKFRDTLKKIQSIEDTSLEDKVETTQTTALFDLLYALKKRNMAHLDSLIKTIPQSISAIQKHLIPSRRMAIHYNLAIANLLLDKTGDAETFFLKVVQDESKGHRDDLRRASDVLHSACQALNPKSKDPAKPIHNTYVKLSQKDKLYQFEKTALNGIRAYLTAKDYQKAEKLIKLHAGLAKLLEKKPPHAPGLKEMTLLIQSKVEGESLRAIYSRKEDI